MEAEHTPETYRHFAVAREVKINLQGVGYRARPRHDDRGLFVGKRKVGNSGEIVGENDFFAKTDGKSVSTGAEIIKGFAPVHDFLSNGLISYNRARDKLREERDIERDIQRIFLRRASASININYIGHRLKCEERNAYGQSDFKRVDVFIEKKIEVFENKCEIFENEKD